MTALDTLAADLIATAQRLDEVPLVTRADGEALSLAEAYVPLLVGFSAEDKAAKGLRKLADAEAPEPAVWFSALEMVCDHPALVLAGEASAGKTTFARHLAACLARGRDPAARDLPRNEHGVIRDEVWTLGAVLPLLLDADGRDLDALLTEAFPSLPDLLASIDWHRSDATLLLILDGIDAASPTLLHDARAFQERFPRIRILALGETSVVKPWPLPAGFVRHDLLPLLRAQRIAALPRLTGSTTPAGLGAAAANPAQFALALAAGTSGDDDETLVEAWLAHTLASPSEAAALCADAFAGLAARTPAAGTPASPGGRRIRQLLAARHLVGEPPETAVALFRRSPAPWTPVLRSLARRLERTGGQDALVTALLADEGDSTLRGALLAADMSLSTDASRDRLAALILAIVANGALTPPERQHAGRILARLGDPRDLAELADIPAGTFTMGSFAHPNSAPPHAVMVAAYRIGRYPVTNASYGAFIRATGRPWRSPDGFAPERANVPATDLTWHDARAYCVWLTGIWRANGTIAADEIVRLPTEPEWERAARGDQPDPGGDVVVYPWGVQWIDDAANSEEAGFNAPCAVGLFPKGRSPYGCLDMAGQVWEWCSTLWGDDMASPGFRYPYTDDGREDPDADPAIRRVLRGGCFSSGLLKANATYRGSLEPAGFWRGNGFRVAVSRSAADPDVAG